MKRTLIDDELRQQIWNRDGGRCQECGKAVHNVLDPCEQIIDQALTLDRIPVYKWTRECWKCKQPTPVVTYFLRAGRMDTIGEIQKLDYTLMARYPFVKKQYSRPLDCQVVANTCSHCGAQQSNLYIAEDIVRLVASQPDPDALVDARLPNTLQLEDFPAGEPELENWQDNVADVGHIHHKDADWRNNEPDNLVLLCRPCHLDVHLG